MSVLSGFCGLLSPSHLWIPGLASRSRKDDSQVTYPRFSSLSYSQPRRFQSGTSSGVVLEMGAVGVSFVKLTGFADGVAPPKGSPSGYYDPGRIGRCASGRKTDGRRRKCCTSLRRKQAANGSVFRTEAERVGVKKSPAGCVALPHTILTEGRSTHPAFPDL